MTIKKVERYQVGRCLFKTLKEAKVHVAKLTAIERVNSMLPRAVDTNCRFANGHGYIQHDKAKVEAFRQAIAELIRSEGFDETVVKSFLEYPRGLAGRCLDDGGSLLYDLWSRSSCIDDKWREWGQAYYALHPEQGTQTEWACVI